MIYSEIIRIYFSFFFSTIREETNWLHAAMTGVANALPMVANIAGNLICFYAFVAMGSHITNWLCMLAGAEDGVCTIEVCV